jgi:SNF2 family DNA or RNA helicase
MPRDLPLIRRVANFCGVVCMTMDAKASSNAPLSAGASRLVLHAQWTEGRLHLWAEDPARWRSMASRQANTGAGGEHPFAASDEEVRALLARIGAEGVASSTQTKTIKLRLPAAGGVPIASPGLSHAVGHIADVEEEFDDELGVDAEDPEEVLKGADALVAEPEPKAVETVVEVKPEESSLSLVEIVVPTIALDPGDAPRILDVLEDVASQSEEQRTEAAASTGTAPVEFGASESLTFFAAAARFVRFLLAQQRFVPMLQQQASGALAGLWQPWLGDDQTAKRVTHLLGAMPPIARAAVDAFGHDAWLMLDDFLLRTGDALCRKVLVKDQMFEAIDGRDPQADLHVAWLKGLLPSALAQQEELDVRPGPRTDLVKGVRRWIGSLEERGSGTSWRLLLKLNEPLDLKGLSDFASPGNTVRWPMTLHLQSIVDPSVIVDASDIWVLPPGAASVEGQRIEQPQELLLSELGRAARIYKRLEKSLESAEPSEIDLTTDEAYKFLREIRPVLLEQGIGIQAPDWWDSPTVRLGARLQVESEEIDLNDPFGAGGSSPGSTVAHLGLSSLVSYKWQIAVGDVNLTLEQFEKLASQHSPLIRLNGKWVEIRPEDLKAAMRFIRENPGGQMEVGRALRLAYATDAKETGVPILGMDATGWVATVFGEAAQSAKMPLIEAPGGFIGTLRAYQLKGLSWLAFLDRLGLGACLADDMGLGKTIQLLALLAHERTMIRARSAEAQAAAADSPAVPVPANGDALANHPNPTLLIVPMSVVANWLHEAERFTPGLKVLVHHGLERFTGDSLVKAARESDMVITTYALANRDKDSLSQVQWSRVVLDEAQNIKNPSAKQTRAIHSIPAPRRIALTGTPLENRLIELWSIMDFLNPGYLGPASEFRTKFAVPIERYHEKHKGVQLRGLVQPFVLRRLKTDPSVITDLPEKVETKEYCYLTPEQAQLYQTCVSDMLAAADRAEGIQRRGLVLAGLIKLKQICNHPAHFLKEFGENGNAAQAAPILAARSGKCARLMEMLQEVVAAGDKALVFTQFRQMGHLLATMLRQGLDRDVLFLHGGTPAAQRQQMINEFQGDKATGPKLAPRAGRTGNAPVLILSLKAGGVGLNLTAANHVFHFDRWWNPAVESQATDRAYRIGQTRTVQVHKFVVSGTLEERIDQMIQQKTELADQIIGHGEAWLTELSTGQLRDLLMLRDDGVASELEEVGA